MWNTADGTTSATVARSNIPACVRALAGLNSCVWCFKPPSRNAPPSMNRLLVTIAPVIEAFTRSSIPARSAAMAMTSSVRLPSVAFSRPPIASPVFAATLSVAWLSRAASGTMAATESRNRAVCASGRRCSATRTTGTNTSSQFKGFPRSSARTRFTGGFPKA